MIMDGNGRWANRRKLSKKSGHEAGIKSCIQICENLDSLDYKISELSFYVFSTENWHRKPKEVNNLFDLIELFYKKFKETAVQNNLIIIMFHNTE